MKKTLNYLIGFIYIILISSCNSNVDRGWTVSVLPASVRLDPVSNEVIESRFTGSNNSKANYKNLLKSNWIYDGEKVNLYGAKGEYVSFQLVITRNSIPELTEIKVEMPPFSNENRKFEINPEMFLEWSVEVQTPSTGYPKASLGVGWYPDALIPIDRIETDTSKLGRRWIYPLILPDFNNRIKAQQSLIIWVDQFIPYNDENQITSGYYKTSISVSIGEEVKEIPVELKVWNFDLPNENLLKASLQHEGFLSGTSEEKELEIYQLFKRNRVGLMDPTYKPGLKVTENGKVDIEWDNFDKRLSKYLTGDAFTESHGYNYGPGYGEPIETFALPFDVYGKHGTKGWPDIGEPNVERTPENIGLYVGVIREVRNHLNSIINPDKTELTVYLNGLDESYFPEAWDRMVYFGDIFKKEYPEAYFRVDGGYSEEAMKVIENSIDSWASHTINYNSEEIKKYQDNGIKVWIYGPMLYESSVNSWVGSSTFIDLPLVNERAISWSTWKYNAYSWISWGVGAGWENGWYDPESWKDFYKTNSEADAEFKYRKLNGNGSLIYKPNVIPNVNVACPSIRLKNMRNGVQEYEYLRLLSKLEGNKENANTIVDRIVNQPFGKNSIGKIDVWDYDAEKWDNARIELGELIDQYISKNNN